MSNADVIARFHQAFQARDAAMMGACYTPDATFRDPVFDLAGWQVPAMWKMLCERGTDLRLEFRDVRATERDGGAHWEAWYTFSATGRQVHNVIDASFQFAGGRIVRHEDRFDFHRWAGQALGPGGRMLGWAPPFHALIRRRSAHALATWARRHGLPEVPT
jgi:ketosteroid isomerase-like protein